MISHLRQQSSNGFEDVHQGDALKSQSGDPLMAHFGAITAPSIVQWVFTPTIFQRSGSISAPALKENRLLMVVWFSVCGILTKSQPRVDE
jgi:hypothetical protein